MPTKTQSDVYRYQKNLKQKITQLKGLSTRIDSTIESLNIYSHMYVKALETENQMLKSSRVVPDSTILNTIFNKTFQTVEPKWIKQKSPITHLSGVRSKYTFCAKEIASINISYTWPNYVDKNADCDVCRERFQTQLSSYQGAIRNRKTKQGCKYCNNVPSTEMDKKILKRFPTNKIKCTSCKVTGKWCYLCMKSYKKKPYCPDCYEGLRIMKKLAKVGDGYS